jgi:hypothetical protein
MGLFVALLLAKVTYPRPLTVVFLFFAVLRFAISTPFRRFNAGGTRVRSRLARTGACALIELLAYSCSSGLGHGRQQPMRPSWQ